jgi:hypothetical protein
LFPDGRKLSVGRSSLFGGFLGLDFPDNRGAMGGYPLPLFGGLCLTGSTFP